MRHLRLVHSVPLSQPPVDNGLTPSGACSPDIDRDDRPFDPAVRALLEHVRIIGPLPRLVRERALARARAALVCPSCATASPPSRARRPWVALVVSVTLAAALGAAVEALLTRGSVDSEQAPHVTAPLRVAED